MVIREKYTVPKRFNTIAITLMVVGILAIVGLYATHGSKSDATSQARFWGSLLQNSVYFLLVVNARHADLLPFSELIDGVKSLLSDKGKFCLILPKTEALKFRELAEAKSFHLSKLLRVRTRLDKDEEKRQIMQFEFHPSEFSESTLVIEKRN